MQRSYGVFAAYRVIVGLIVLDHCLQPLTAAARGWPRRYDGIAAGELAPRLGVPASSHSTLRRVDARRGARTRAAEGAPAGTLILADAQTAGRGRLGRRWQSEAGAGVWLTLIERPRDGGALDVLSLRVGLGTGAGA